MVDDLAERVRRALSAEYRLWWGHIARIESLIGRPSGYLSRVVSGEITPFRRDLSKILAALGIQDPNRWMRRRVTPALDTQALLADLPRPRYRPSPLRLLRSSLRKALAQVEGKSLPGVTQIDFDRLPLREVSDLLSSCSSSPLARGAIPWLDLLRYEDPRQAATLARKLTLACRDLGPDSLDLSVQAGLVWASALRFAGDLITSGLILKELAPYAWRLGRAVEADLFQRLAPLLRDYLRISDALAAIDEAQSLFLRDGDMLGCAKTYVDRALCFYTAGRADDAARMARAAIALLPESAQRHRSAAFLVIGLASGQNQHVDRAEQLLSPAFTYDRLSIAYGRAQLAKEPEVEEKYLREARELALRANPFDAALMTLHLVRLLTDQGRLTLAASEVREAFSLLGPLRAHTTACMALVELSRLGERLTIDAVATAQKAIRDARVSLPTPPGDPSC